MNLPLWYPRKALPITDARFEGWIEISGGNFMPSGFDVVSLDGTLNPMDLSCVFDPEYLVQNPSEDTMIDRKKKLGGLYGDIKFWRHVSSPAWIEQGVPIRHYKFMEQSMVKSNPIFSKPLPLP